MLGLLLDTDLSSTQRDFAQTAQVCGRALIALINEVLDRAKIEAGKLELEAVPFDLRSILDDVLSLFSEKSRNKGVEVSYSELQQLQLVSEKSRNKGVFCLFFFLDKKHRNVNRNCNRLQGSSRKLL